MSFSKLVCAAFALCSLLSLGLTACGPATCEEACQKAEDCFVGEATYESCTPDCLDYQDEPENQCFLACSVGLDCSEYRDCVYECW